MTITWKIETLRVARQHAELEDVVISADWRATATDENGLTATCNNTVTFGEPDHDCFLPFLGLAEEDVLRWAFNSGVDKDLVEASLASQIAAQINPPIVNLPGPWLVSQQVEAPVQPPAEEPLVEQPTEPTEPPVSPTK